MKTNEIKTIDVVTLTWFDRSAGNIYFAQRITLNFAMPDQADLVNPFQYGYGSYEYEAMQRIKKDIPDFDFSNTWKLREAGIIMRTTTHANCKQRELKNI